MVSVLPERPDLGQLRRRAKELRNAAALGDPMAFAQVTRYSDSDHVSLSAAQLAVAREYGFASWPRLTLEVRRKRMIERGDTAGLAQLLAAHPALATEGISSALSSPGSSALDYVAVARFHGGLDQDCAGAVARVLIAAGAPVDVPAGSGGGPLITAASYGETDMVRALIRAGADLEATGDAVPGGTALAHAVEYGVTGCVDVLVRAGAAVHGIVNAAGAGRVGHRLIEAASPDELARALRAAAVCERLGSIDLLLAEGVDVNVRVEGDTALHWAAWHAKAASVRHLIDCGADPRSRDRQYGMTPLAWYRFRRNELAGLNNPGHLADADSLERLLDAGRDDANPEGRDGNGDG